jgi:regulator of sigma E protease
MEILSLIGKYAFEGLIFLLIFSVIIVIHELGHFLSARRAGVKVEEFGFGLPPKLWGKKTSRKVSFKDENGKVHHKEETMEWTINAIPFGGFVRMLGEDEKENSTDPRAFGNRPIGWKILIVCGGVIMNFILGWFLLMVIAIVGFSPIYPTQEQKDQYISEGFLEEKEGIFLINTEENESVKNAGIKEYDKIVAINGNSISGIIYAEELIQNAQKQQDQNLSLSVERFITKTRTFEQHTLQIPLNEENSPFSIAKEGVIVQKVLAKSVAEKRNIMPNDRILYIENQQIGSPKEFINILEKRTKDEVNTLHLGIQKWNSEKEEYDNLTSVIVTLPKDGKLGIEIGFGVGKISEGKAIIVQDSVAYPVNPVKIPILKAPLFALQESWRFIDLSVDMLKNLLVSIFTAFQLPEGIGGPVSIAHTTGKLVELGDISRIIQFAAVLSLSLAVINIMPFPALDGGRLFFLLIELGMIGSGRGMQMIGIKKKFPQKIPQKWEIPLHGIGYLLLLALIIAVTWRDISTIFFS